MAILDVALAPLTVKSFDVDHALSAEDHFCILNFTAKANLTIAPGACSPGFIAWITCPVSSRDCGSVIPAEGVMINEEVGERGLAGMVPGINTLMQTNIDVWSLGFAQSS